MKTWIARDEDGALWLYLNYEPRKSYEIWTNDADGCVELDSNLFPEVTWEDEAPIGVELIIKPLTE